MPKNRLPDPDVEPIDPGSSAESSYDAPVELDDGDVIDLPEAEQADEPAGIRRPARLPPPGLKLGIAVGALLVVGAGLLAYRAHHRRQVLATGLARAEALLRLDTASGFREAAGLLAPLAELDPLEAGSSRAFALAMLHADYREPDADLLAEALLIEPDRAAEVPRPAHLARAALALGRSALGDATGAASRASGSPWAHALHARIALLAGTSAAAIEAAHAAAQDGAFAAGLAIQGDVARRAKNDPAAARAAYAAALAASPTHPRATFGLAKLALAGKIPPADAASPLQRLLDDRKGTPAPERGRAALHLAALRLRAGDRAASAAALDAAGLDGPARAWAESAAAKEAADRGRYEVVGDAPDALRSASDDDPYVLPPPPPISDHVGVDPLDARPPPPPRAAASKHAVAKPARATAPRPGARIAKATAKAPSKTAATRTAAAKKAAAKKATAKKAPSAKRSAPKPTATRR
jgi:hypothetical protein